MDKGIRTHTVYCEDCLKTMSRLPDDSIDLVITSPPYDFLRTYNGYSFDFENTAKELYRIVKGTIVWVVGDATIKGSETCTSFEQALYFKRLGFNLHDTMIYHKDNPVPVGGSNRYYQAFEYMFVFSKGIPKFNPIMVDRRNKYNDKRVKRFRGVNRDTDGNFIKKEVIINEKVKKNNVWTYTVGGGISTKDKAAFKHPAIFPEKLVHDHILSWSDSFDLIYDPFAGSGTVGIVANELNRYFLMSEVSYEYCNIMKERFNSRFDFDINIIKEDL